jgi:hypothetical protein
MKYDLSTVTVLRRALDEVILDPRFLNQKSRSTLEIAEYLLSLAAGGERDLERLKSIVFVRLIQDSNLAA